jgi:hypothetical protein
MNNGRQASVKYASASMLSGTFHQLSIPHSPLPTPYPTPCVPNAHLLPKARMKSAACAQGIGVARKRSRCQRHFSPPLVNDGALYAVKDAARAAKSLTMKT